jgi:hypothetical protein
MLALNSSELVASIEPMDADFFIVDTPGQIELFAFRSSSRVLIDALGRERALLAYIFDPNLARQPTGYVSSHLLAATVEFRLGLPTLNVLGKADLMTPEELEALDNWGSEPESLLSALWAEPGAPHTPLTNELARVVETLGIYRKLTAASSQTGEGIADIYAAAQLLFDGGEDLERRFPRSA